MKELTGRPIVCRDMLCLSSDAGRGSIEWVPQFWATTIPQRLTECRSQGDPPGWFCFYILMDQEVQSTNVEWLACVQKNYVVSSTPPISIIPFLVSMWGKKYKEIKMGANEEHHMVVLSPPCSLFSALSPIWASLISLLSPLILAPSRMAGVVGCKLQGCKQLLFDSFLLPPLYSLGKYALLNSYYRER